FMNDKILHIIGAGLAGSEAAWQTANIGIQVVIHEMRPEVSTPAHKTGKCAELVCSNSFRSDDAEYNAVGLLHEEMRKMGSIIMKAADMHAVPAGGALAVDREKFSEAVSGALKDHPNITIVHEEIKSLEGLDWENVIVATGPLTSDALIKQIQDLTEIIALMVGQLSEEERAVVDKALIETYKQFGFSLRKTKTKKVLKFPKLIDFYKTLKKMKKRDLCNRLERFVKGSLANIFDSQTNIELNNRLIVIDIKDLNESIRPIMMLVVANFVNSQVKEKPQKRILVIDEGWILLQQEESARFVSGLVRRARKYFLGVTIISQQASDFLSQEYGRAIASQSSLRVLMKQDTTTIKKVTEEFHLSGWEQRFLLTCDRGEALIIADQNHVALKVIASEKEHPLLTTDPKEIYI
ncbi:MAG: hypothetical protein EOM23_02670, partial [Candidatus Moranbacteria bacterium]|nr:hypothetical protein [Candidatus Moranbacteria bacterium]